MFEAGCVGRFCGGSEFDGDEGAGDHGLLHGYGIARRIQQVSKDLLNLNQGTVCPALLRPEQRGWVRSKWDVSENNRKARYYSLTAAGRRQLVAEAARWERMAAMIAGMLAGTEGA